MSGSAGATAVGVATSAQGVHLLFDSPQDTKCSTESIEERAVSIVPTSSSATKSARAPEWLRMYAHSGGASRGLTGTGTSPALDAAKITAMTSTELLPITPMRSPGAKPMSISATARPLTLASASAYVVTVSPTIATGTSGVCVAQ